MAKGKNSPEMVTCPFTTLGWNGLLLPYLEGSWICGALYNLNIMWSSALIGCFTARLISVAHTANRSLLSDVNDGEIRHQTLYVWACIRRRYRFWEILQECLASVVWTWSLRDAGGVNEAWERVVSEGADAASSCYKLFWTCLFHIFWHFRK